ncbi:MAG: hypothetical protein EOP56_18235 [Sphingobacteriales bacterium]|nr:MAG: hypothetical protein EOP56_18235 [Sphingobacteriales bacterium]
MKKILSLLVLLAGATGTVLSQDSQCEGCPKSKPSKTTSSFDITNINHRHIVSLPKGNKMIVEMVYLEDYEMLQNINRTLTDFKNSLVPFHDSLDAGPSGTVRIDYLKSTTGNPNKIMIRRYSSNGDLFVENNGNISHLKIEQDTVNIKFEHIAKTMFGKASFHIPRPIQLKLILNNLNEIDSLIKEDMLQHYIDTMSQVSQQSKLAKDLFYKTTILYYPGRSGKIQGMVGSRFMLYKGITSGEDAYMQWIHHPKRIGAVVDVGAGLVRNTIAPVAEAGLEYRFSKKAMRDYIPMVRLSASCYFMFDKKADGNYQTNDNWFVNAEFGNIWVDDGKGQYFKKMTAGAGYLFKQRGTYFTGTTFKAFLNFPLGDQFVIAPEVIATNNFKGFFPGVTFKGFLFRD